MKVYIIRNWNNKVIHAVYINLHLACIECDKLNKACNEGDPFDVDAYDVIDYDV